MKILAGFALIAAPVVLGSHSAEAGTIYCGARPDVVALLASDFREQTSSVGVTGDGQLLEVLTNENGATWSIVLTDKRGQSCIVATGEGWQDRNPDPAMLEPQL
ncbi:MAG: hypothetical protein ACKVOI_04405 [Dongiaceae bacterium]